MERKLIFNILAVVLVIMLLGSSALSIYEYSQNQKLIFENNETKIQLQTTQGELASMLTDLKILLQAKNISCEGELRLCLSQEVIRYTELSKIAHINFANPTIKWKEQSSIDYYIKDFSLVELSIVAVSVGEMYMSKYEKNLIDGGYYKDGDKAFAVAFDIQPRVIKHGSIYLHIKRILNDQGETIKSNTGQFHFPDTGGLQADQEITYPEQKVVFVVPTDEKEFTFSTGGAPNILFKVKLVNGSIEVEKIE